MLDLIGWLLSINENSNLREELCVLKSRQPLLAPLSLDERMKALEAENEELKLRLGLLIRMLAQRGCIDIKEFVVSFKEFQSSPKK